MFNEVASAHAVFPDVGDDFFHNIVLMKAGEQKFFLFKNARRAVFGDFFLFLDVADKAVDQVQKAVAL